MLKILLVDDEKQEREGVRFLIEQYGFPLEISEAINGKAALEYLQGHRVDILFTDIKMPYMDGLDLANEVGKIAPDTVIIIFSAYSEFEYAKRACEAHAVNYLLKPIEVDEFREVMEKAIAICQRRQSLEEEKLFLKNADKKALLYRMMNTAGEDTDSILQQLQKYDVVLDNKYLLFFSIETENGYFESENDEFAGILSNRIKMKYEYINMHQDHSYVLLYGSQKSSDSEIERMIRGIYSDVKQGRESTISIIVGEWFYGVDKLQEKIEEMISLKEEIFSYFSGIQYAKKISRGNHDMIDRDLRLKERLRMCIKEKNLPAVRSSMEEYVKKIEQEKSSSSFYIKYNILDIVKELLEEFGIYNQTKIFEISEKIMKCSSLKEMQSILNLVLEQIENNMNVIEDDSRSTVKEIQKIISNEYMDDLSLDKLSERIYLTPAYISYIFKQETGKNFVKYLMDYRLQKAKEMLEEGKMKIMDIGRSCGYPNQSYFNRIFKNNFGVTPKQYRENADEKQIE